MHFRVESKKFKTIKLSSDAVSALKNGYRRDDSPRFRQRCHIVLLNQHKQVSETANIVQLSTFTVYQWLARYRRDGIGGLRTKKGQGRKPILKHEEQAIIKQTVQQERQRLKFVHEELQQKLGKTFSQKTLKRILKNSAVDISE